MPAASLPSTTHPSERKHILKHGPFPGDRKGTCPAHNRNKTLTGVQSFSDVPITDAGVDTVAFLQAAEGVVSLFGAWTEPNSTLAEN